MKIKRALVVWAKGMLFCICTAWVYSQIGAAGICYAKSDADKEKVEEFVTAYYEAHTAEEKNLYSEEKDYTNPYALDTETKTGGYLYAVFEANKGCDADGEWFGSADILTKASFEWGNIFTVVDMENTDYSTCTAVPANFNRVTGEKYEFDDLFNTDSYKEELLEIIRNKFDDGYDHGWNIILEPDRVSFVISYHGLLLCQDWKPRTLLIEWSELEDILSQEIISDVLEYTWEVSIAASDLSWSEAPEEVAVSDDNDTVYQIVKKTKNMKTEKENFTDISDVDYPVIEFRDEAANKEVGDKINELLYDVAMYHYDQALEQEVNAFYACQYFITSADENYICIYYIEYIGSGMGRPSYFEDAVTVSLKTGEAVSLGEFIDTDNIMERAKNYTGTIYTDTGVEQWMENKEKFTEEWKKREDAIYYGYYLYNGRIGFFFDYYRTGRVRIAAEFEGMEIAN